ncbi:MAG: hypothetical protein HZB65_03875 [Candidatus Aenigmarchaeota archaeon]|nr:hypothetical protein [Candidatus Aenigmarchaeota archaeon]
MLDKTKKYLKELEIENVLELHGARHYMDSRSDIILYAHVSKPMEYKDNFVQYVMLAPGPQHGMIHLGEIDPETRCFRFFDKRMRIFGIYKRATNNVVNKVCVPHEQLEKLKTLNEILKINGIYVKREMSHK